MTAVAVPARALNDRRLSRSDLHVLAVLCGTARDGHVRLAQGTIAARIGLSRSSVNCAIGRLVAAGYVAREAMKRPDGGTASYRYRVLDRITPTVRGRPAAPERQWVRITAPVDLGAAPVAPKDLFGDEPARVGKPDTPLLEIPTPKTQRIPLHLSKHDSVGVDGGLGVREPRAQARAKPPPSRSAAQLREAVQLWLEANRGVGQDAPEPFLTGMRRKRLAHCLRLAGGLEGWRIALEKFQATPFLHGANRRGWRMTFDYLIKPENFARLMEGGYDDFAPEHGGFGGGTKFDQWMAAAHETLAG